MKINVDYSKRIGTIKPMHGVGQPPFINLDFSKIHYLKDANIPFSRLHDVGGFLGGSRFVDIPNLFRDFDKDPEDPNSYDFVFTDLLINSLVQNGVKPFFRLGVTIENDAKIKAYRIYPPKDFKKWAKICEGVIKHYNYGWANGFHHNIEYWEIWNEPDNDLKGFDNQMWLGTKEEFYELYSVSSTYLKSKFPELKIGGYGSCGFYAITNSFVEGAKSSPRTDYFIEFFEEFLKYIKRVNCPLDFFSWHSYESVKGTKQFAEYARKMLDDNGFIKTESICNEWNCEPFNRGTARHAAVTAAMMISFQNTSLDSAMFYDARIGVSDYSGLFNPLTTEPFPAYYAMYYFGKLFKLKNQCKVECEHEDIYTLSAADKDDAGLLICNPTDNEYELSILHPGYLLVGCYVTDKENTNSKCKIVKSIKENSLIYIEFKKSPVNP